VIGREIMFGPHNEPVTGHFMLPEPLQRALPDDFTATRQEMDLMSGGFQRPQQRDHRPHRCVSDRPSEELTVVFRMTADQVHPMLSVGHCAVQVADHNHAAPFLASQMTWRPALPLRALAFSCRTCRPARASLSVKA